MKILVTGGSGYKGAVLVPRLLREGHEVISLDTNWFGDNLKDHQALTKIKADVREIGSIPLKGVDSIIHLANKISHPTPRTKPLIKLI